MRKATSGNRETRDGSAPTASVESAIIELDPEPDLSEAYPGWLKANPSHQAEGGLAASFSRPGAVGLRLPEARRTRDDLRGESRSRPVRHLSVLFRRNPEHDGQNDRVRYEGYHICWPDGQPVSIGFQRFCQLGSRLLGLGRRMEGKDEQLVDIGFHEVEALESPLTRVACGVRTRRFYLERYGSRGRIYFLNGTPTDMFFDELSDDPRVLSWLGWHSLRDGTRRWFDLSARSVT